MCPKWDHFRDLIQYLSLMQIVLFIRKNNFIVTATHNTANKMQVLIKLFKFSYCWITYWFICTFITEISSLYLHCAMEIIQHINVCVCLYVQLHYINKYIAWDLLVKCFYSNCLQRAFHNCLCFTTHIHSLRTTLRFHSLNSFQYFFCTLLVIYFMWTTFLPCIT